MTGVHYASQDGAEHAVLAWRPTTRFGHPPTALVLPALDPTARYPDLDAGTPHSGAVLVRRGIGPALPAGDYASSLIRLRRTA
ncbi:GH36 C-terminal domain-containing protein [Streptomyces sp. NPDC001933]|uniref:GH36 C-terminal domain-containing protein n=1 Tax=Streptomyces sp. NPDC001933 TaxID=3364626 RepID=UPI0036A93EF0